LLAFKETAADFAEIYDNQSGLSLRTR